MNGCRVFLGGKQILLSFAEWWVKPVEELASMMAYEGALCLFQQVIFLQDLELKYLKYHDGADLRLETINPTNMLA